MRPSAALIATRDQRTNAAKELKYLLSICDGVRVLTQQ
ncbi:hypothetical protein FM107_06195 [Sphingobacterium sp. JB170]|nr:hypothetical protein FM107_06195 [Sphingobacterium sp. JB170]